LNAITRASSSLAYFLFQGGLAVVAGRPTDEIPNVRHAAAMP
jgi:hypothetical protein